MLLGLEEGWPASRCTATCCWGHPVGRGAVAPRGIVGLEAPSRLAPLLRVEGLVKRFGALAATDGASFEVQPGELHA